MSKLLDIFSKGATVKSAGAQLGVDDEMAALMADHYARIGMLQLPSDPGCSNCPSVNPEAPKRLSCAGCPFAR